MRQIVVTEGQSGMTYSLIFFFGWLGDNPLLAKEKRAFERLKRPSAKIDSRQDLVRLHQSISVRVVMWKTASVCANSSKTSHGGFSSVQEARF